MVSACVDEPVEVGAKRTPSVQEPFGAKLAEEQLSATIEYGEVNPPRLPMIRLASPTLLMVTVWVLLEPTSTSPNTLLPLTEMSGAALVLVPLPLTLTLTGFSSGSSEDMLSVPDLLPVTVGEKRTLIVQALPGVTVPQLFELIEKGEIRPPAPVTDRLAVPVLLTVMLRVLLLPT